MQSSREAVFRAVGEWRYCQSSNSNESESESESESELSRENNNFADVWSELGIEADSEGEDSIPASLFPPADGIQVQVPLHVPMNDQL
ncbi:hypothetical protein V6N13_138481 [Hibiscus sabdariffa]|uniref:Uncharacterized protein n=1 Tax=Hibiscus sabdariffa TaxID=183260 RepID=A0ABR2QDS4_9ROSI